MGAKLLWLCPTFCNLWTVARQAPLSMRILQARILGLWTWDRACNFVSLPHLDLVVNILFKILDLFSRGTWVLSFSVWVWGYIHSPENEFGLTFILWRHLYQIGILYTFPWCLGGPYSQDMWVLFFKKISMLSVFIYWHITFIRDHYIFNVLALASYVLFNS